jgi:resuscitation-promoting factor RpfB
MVALLFIGLTAAAIWVARGIGMPITVSVDGYRETVRSTRPDVARLLADLDLSLRPEDDVTPALDTALTPGLRVTVSRARRHLVSADGAVREVYSHAATVQQLLISSGYPLSSYDEVWVDGSRVAQDAALPAAVIPAQPVRFARSHAWVGREAEPVRVSVRRAVRIVVDDGSVPYPIFTTAATVGDALLREQVTLYLGDQVQPSLGSPVSAGQRINIVRSKPVLITADGRTVRTRSRGKTVGDALTELGVTVAGSDRVSPAMADALTDNVSVRVVRIRQTTLVERETIPFEAISVSDENLEIDHQQMTQTGADGEFRRRFQLVYEDGKEVKRALTDAWVAVEPITQVVAYGRKIVPRPIETERGTLMYWRKVRMYATSYSKSTAGVSPSSPSFGHTRSGLPMQRGLVAVDPTVIPLGSQIYVPGYGVGLAADTGGGVRGRFVDLGYDDENLQPWHQWVDVYWLTPVYSPARIRWVLPNWPQYR